MALVYPVTIYKVGFRSTVQCTVLTGSIVRLDQQLNMELPKGGGGLHCTQAWLIVLHCAMLSLSVEVYKKAN